MARRGRCRCGTILRFHRTPQGYKTRCPNCKSVVRLRLAGQDKPPSTPLPGVTAPAERTDCISVPVTGSSGAVDLAGLDASRSTGPPVLVELQVYREPVPRPSFRQWLLLGGITLALMILVTVVMVLCS